MQFNRKTRDCDGKQIDEDQPKIVLQRERQSSMTSQAAALSSKLSTVTFLLSRILQVSKKALILLMVATGMSDKSLYWVKAGSFSGTPRILSSISPVSIMFMRPNTLTATRVLAGILMLEMIMMSRASSSWPMVLGMKPQLMGKATGVARMRSSLIIPLCSSSSIFPLDPSVISTTPFMKTGEQG